MTYIIDFAGTSMTIAICLTMYVGAVLLFARLFRYCKDDAE